MSMIASLADIIKEAEQEYRTFREGGYVPVEAYGENPENMLVHGECLDFMNYLLDEMDMEGKINMIYVDPPFFTKMKHEAVVRSSSGNNISIPAYQDTWKNGSDEYFRMLCLRLFAMKDLLAEDGCIWMHLDWHMAHYLKVIMDEIFGMKHFINEVVWQYKSGGSSKKHFARKHDNLLFYAKSDSYYFKPQQEKSYNREFKPYRFKGVEEFQDETGWYTMVNMKDVWQIDMVGRTSKERTGYATQKPEALLMRIMESCTRPGDLVADFFGGSATTAAAAAKMGRRFISCDGGSLAVSMAVKRLEKTDCGFTVYDRNNKYLKEDKKIKVNCDIIDVKAYIDETEGTDREIDIWSVDLDFNGLLHNSKLLFGRQNGQLQKEVQLVNEQISIFDQPEERLEAGEAVSIVFYDIQGNREQYIFKE